MAIFGCAEQDGPIGEGEGEAADRDGAARPGIRGAAPRRERWPLFGQPREEKAELPQHRPATEHMRPIAGGLGGRQAQGMCVVCVVGGAHSDPLGTERCLLSCVMVSLRGVQDRLHSDTQAVPGCRGISSNLL